MKLHSKDWTIAAGTTTRGPRGVAAALPGLPDDFLTAESSVAEEFVAAARPRGRGAAAAPGALDFSIDLAAGEAAVLAVRSASGALTFHAPLETTRRMRGGQAEVRFIVPVPRPEPSAATRAAMTRVMKAIVVKVAGSAVDSVVGLALETLALAFETAAWTRKGLAEEWLKVDKASLLAQRLAPGRPTSTDRSLLLLHGTFSNAASTYASLGSSDFFEQVAPLYGDRIFAFDHFSVSRTPEDNARMLLEQLPDKRFTFDVVTYSRGGLVLRNLVERKSTFGPLSSRFTVERAVLVAAPNEGTPLATLQRWAQTVEWIANLLELFPDHPFTTGAEFVANGLVWIARHASGNLPGLHAMDGDGDPIRELQGPPSPPAERYSALVANFNPTGDLLRRLVDIGLDRFFNSANDLVVPSEGGWRVDPSGGSFIPGSRIGCFGPGGNLPGDTVTHLNFFSHADAVTFIVKALAGQAQSLAPLDPAQPLPDRRLLRAGAPGVSTPVVTRATRPAAGARTRTVGSVVEPPTTPASTSRPLEITVVNGDLTFEQLPLMVGHYHASLLTGTEWILDNLLGGAMTNALDLGIYPNEPGTHRIFINRHVAKGKPWLTPRPEAVIVAGLGREGKLQGMDVVRTVRQAVIAWAERVAEQPGKAKPLSLVTTLLASGGAGVTEGQAARLIAQGVREANQLIEQYSATGRRRLPQVRALCFVELYLDRANEAWRSLKMLAELHPGRFTVTEPIVEGLGALPRPLDSGYRGAHYDFISAETRREPNGSTSIAYALDTKRARTEVRAQATQSRLLRNLVATASSDQAIDDQLGRTLFQLLIPFELGGFLSGTTETQIELDEGTAGIPWELLDDGDPKGPIQQPWAIRSKLLRKFRTENFRMQVTDADTEDSILVIGEPEAPPDYLPLPGARQEAKDVYACFTSDSGIDPKLVKPVFTEQPTLPGPDALTVVNALFERNWRVIHVAGHGEPIGADGGPGGVVLSNKTFLGPNEIKALRVVPELVFINCCYLGGVSTNAVLRVGETRRGLHDRTLFAAGTAEALINLGVRCVVAAGWAVDDGAAGDFAKTFYRALLEGARFIDAVAQARVEAFKTKGNTWAAYQCYGDPDWVFKAGRGRTGTSRRASEREFDNVGSVAALRLALETLIVQSTYQGFDASYQLERARHLEERSRRMKWSVPGDIGERFAQVFAAAGDLAKAIEWSEAVVGSRDGDASFRAIERGSTLRVRQAWQVVEELRDTRDRSAAKQRRAALDAARRVIKEEATLLSRLSGFNATAERESLQGAAMKRLAMVEAEAGRRAAQARAYKAMKRHYQRALEIRRKHDAPNLHDPALNVIAAELALNAGTRAWKGLDPAIVKAARESLRAKNQSDPDFASLAGHTELRLFEAVARGTLAKHARAIERGYSDLFKRTQGAAQWGSVHDTATLVLSNYIDRASGAGRKASQRLLDALQARTDSFRS